MNIEFTKDGHDVWNSDHWSEDGGGYIASVSDEHGTQYTYYKHRSLPKDKQEAWEWAKGEIYKLNPMASGKSSYLKKIGLKIPYISGWTWKQFEGASNSIYKSLVSSQEFLENNKNIDHQVLSNYRNMLLGYRNNMTKSVESFKILETLIQKVDGLMKGDVKENLDGDRQHEFSNLKDETETKPKVDVMEDKYKMLNESIQHISNELEDIYFECKDLVLKYDRKILENRKEKVDQIAEGLEDAKEYLISNVKSGVGYGNVMQNLRIVNKFKIDLINFLNAKLSGKS